MLRRILIAILSAMLVTVLTGTPASAVGSKQALVIGNGLYRNGPDLKNPVPDARAISGQLEDLGYAVTHFENLALSEMSTALAAFSRQLGPHDTVVVFFAGHGVLVDGTTYLMPTDALMRDQHDLITAFPVNEILDVLRSDLRAGVVLIDACRDNPLLQVAATRSLRTGATSQHNLKLPFGVVIGYAAQPGAVAYDGNGNHSPYVTALLNHMSRPGVDVELMLRDVRRDVVFSTGGAQVTWTQSSLLDGFSLAELPPPPPEPVVVQQSSRRGLFERRRQERLARLRTRLCSAISGRHAALCAAGETAMGGKAK